MKKIIPLFFIVTFSVETHNFDISNYKVQENEEIILIKNISSHYNQNFWFIKRIFDLCGNFKVDPVLIVALIKVESSFIENAVSRTGAYGYCQITHIANKDIDPALNRYDSTDNLMLGVLFVEKLLNRFGGNITNALSYYNVGTNYKLNSYGKVYVRNIIKEYNNINALYRNNKTLPF